MIETLYISDYGFTPERMPKDAAGIPARITATHRGRYQLVSDRGDGFARLKAGAYYTGAALFPTVGDFVLIDWQEGGESRIVKTLCRKTAFLRTDPSYSGHREQAVAANFDYVFILQSLNHDFNPRRMERYLTLAWNSGAVPVVLLTKADLAGDCAAQIREAEMIAMGAAVFAVSAKSGSGLDALGAYVTPRKTIVFLGSSGVGKSSLINALAGKELMATGEIRDDDSKGRHTTTSRQLFLLPGGVMAIDTPGMRELGMWDVTDGIEKSFSDVEQYFGLCRFSDCRHQSEPGCAVKAAIARAELPPERWESYLRLRHEAKYVDHKADFLRWKQSRCKEIAVLNRQKQRAQKGANPEGGKNLAK